MGRDRALLELIYSAGTRAAEAYSRGEVSERHRHRYEVNKEFLPRLEQGGVVGREQRLDWIDSLREAEESLRAKRETWEDITPDSMPEWGTVNNIELSAHDAGRAFLPVHRYRMDDFTPHVYRLVDYGNRSHDLSEGPAEWRQRACDRAALQEYVRTET